MSCDIFIMVRAFLSAIFAACANFIVGGFTAALLVASDAPSRAFAFVIRPIYYCNSYCTVLCMFRNLTVGAIIMSCLVAVIRILLTTCIFNALADGYLTGPLTASLSACSSLSYQQPLGRGVASSLRVSFEDTAETATTATTIPVRPTNYASIIPPSVASDIEEVLARSMLENIKLVDVVISDPSSFSTVSSLPIPSSFVKFMPTDASVHASSSIPVVMIHGFDSSCLEYRRLAPLLGRHREVYVPGDDYLSC